MHTVSKKVGSKKGGSIFAVLHNIRSSHNVGSMFRTADALGIEKVFLTGYTPAPKDRFGRTNAEIAKVALGAETNLEWEAVEDVFSLLEKLRAAQVEIVSIEQDARSEDYKKYTLPADVSKSAAVFIFGNEVDGVPKEIIDISDKILEITMRGKKESLNVSVAFGIALARVLGL